MRAFSLLLAFLLIVPLLVALESKAAQSNDSDGRIHDELVTKLANDTDVRGGGLDVIVKNGAVTLRGQVHTEKGKEKAGKIAKKVKGVVSVDNQLELFGAN